MKHLSETVSLLSIEDTKIWLDHLQTVLNNRKQARKLALLDSDAQSDLNYEQNYCGSCGKEYVDEAETPELWIACDLCDVWYCM